MAGDREFGGHRLARAVNIGWDGHRPVSSGLHGSAPDEAQGQEGGRDDAEQGDGGGAREDGGHGSEVGPVGAEGIGHRQTVVSVSLWFRAVPGRRVAGGPVRSGRRRSAQS